jgi:hypothetical protein
MKITIYAALLCLIAFSCSKERRKNWLVLDLELRSSLTNELADADIELIYLLKDQDYSSKDFDTIPLGSTQNGVLKIEKKLPTKEIRAAFIIAFGKGYFGIPGEKYYDGFMNPAAFKRAREIKGTITPVYRLELSAVNVACFDETDSLWLGYHNSISDSVETELYVGCLSDTFEKRILYSRNKTAQFIVKWKKNGVTHISYPYFEMEADTMNYISIDY